MRRQSCSGSDIAVLFALSLAHAPAFGQARSVEAPPATAAKPAVPDPTHILARLPADIHWQPAGTGQFQAPLYGDQSKPGPYALLVKWLPGHMSRPHTHSTDRWAYVVSGTWWVSSSDHYDPATTYPLPKGSFSIDVADKVHWDGAKDEETVILLFGVGPVVTRSAVAR